MKPYHCILSPGRRISPTAMRRGQIARTVLAGLAMALAFSQPVHATDLLQAWQAAQAHDPQLAAAQQALAAGQARTDQADSLWRPTIEAQASVGYATQESQTRGAQFSAPGFGTSQDVEFNTSVRNGTRSEYGIELRQALIDPKRRATQEQLRHSAAQAQAAWSAASQQAMLRTTQRYFDVLLAQYGLAVLHTQRETVRQMLSRAQARYRIGDSSILDTHEAQARLDLLDSQYLLAKVRLELAQSAFHDATGLPGQGLLPLRVDTPRLTARPAESLQDWLARAADTSPEVRQSQEAAAMAAAEAAKHRAIASPTLELVGGMGRSHLSGTGEFGDAASSSKQWMAGLQLRIPLYTGGMRGARYQEALAQRDQARFQVQATSQGIAQNVRAAWLSLDTGKARIHALNQAFEASAARRDATRLGLEVGERSTLDWLSAEDAVAQIDQARQQALIELAMDRLHLQALAGRLDANALQSLNCALEGTQCP